MKRKYSVIELMRFFVAILVVWFHFDEFYVQKHVFPLTPSLVEFFFIISGFFMMKYLSEKENSMSECDYICKKIGSFYPVYAVTCSVQFVIFILINQIKGFTQTALTLFHFKWEFLLLHSVGFIQNPQFGVDYLQGQTWYLSAMIIALVVAYPLAKHYRKAFLSIICPLTMILTYSFIIQELGTLNIGNEYFGIVQIAIVRGFAGTCAGCLAYEGYRKLQGMEFSGNLKTAVQYIEWFCYAALFALLVFGNKMSEEDGLFYVPVLMVLLALACLNKTTISRTLNNTAPAISSYLGNLSLYLYLCHWNVLMALRYLVPEMSWEKVLLMYIPAVFIYALALQFLDKKRDGIKPVILICLITIAIGFAAALFI